MMRYLLIILALAASAWSQDGCPWSNGGSGGANSHIGGIAISGTSLVTCTPGSTADCLKAYCGIPSNAADAGAPNGNVSTGLAYSNNSATPGIITNQRQRAWDVYLPNGATAYTGGKCVMFIQGGGGTSTAPNAPMILPTTGGACPVPNGTPPTFWQIADPNHNNNTTGGRTVINVNYGVSAQGTVQGTGAGGSVLIGDLTLTVTVPANRYWPANADCSGGNVCQMQMEQEEVTITTQTGTDTKGSASPETKTLTVTRGTNGTSAAAHVANLNGWINTSIANGDVSSNSPLDLWDGACAAASAIHQGICSEIDFFGESHGGAMAERLANSTVAQRSAWLTAGNCEYTETNWNTVAFIGLEPPADQQADAVLPSDNTQSITNATSLGGVSGNPSGTINAQSSGGLNACSPQNTLWGTYTVTADNNSCGGCTGTTTTYTRTATTALGTYAYNLSMINDLPLTVTGAVSVGLSDQDVCTSVVKNYATAAGIPLVTVTGGHGGDLGACGQAWNPASLMLKQVLVTLDIPDCTYGTCTGTLIPAGVSFTSGASIQ